MNKLIGSGCKPEPAGNPPPSPASGGERTCLMCGKKFPSAGPQNRKCIKCKKKKAIAGNPAIGGHYRASRKKAIF